MTQLRQMVLDELQRRNYAAITSRITCGSSMTLPGIAASRSRSSERSDFVLCEGAEARVHVGVHLCCAKRHPLRKYGRVSPKPVGSSIHQLRVWPRADRSRILLQVLQGSFVIHFFLALLSGLRVFFRSRCYCA